MAAAMSLVAFLAHAQFPVNIGTLPPGKTVTVMFDATVNDPIPANTVEVSNQGTVSGSNFASVLTDDPDVGGASDPTVTGVPQADLEVTITDSADPVEPGDPFTYTVTVNNASPSDAEDVEVTTTLPSGVIFVSTTGCAEDPIGVSTCSLGTITSGGSTQFTISVAVDSGTSGTITAQVTVASTTHDPVSANNSDSEDTLVVFGTSTALVSSGSPSDYGDPVTFTATVTSSSTTPTGSVEFFDGAASLGTRPLDVGGVAALTTSDLPAGLRSITATYNGDATHATSTSAPLAHTVNQASTTTTITADTPDPSFTGEDVTVSFTVSETATGGVAPTGNVQISDGVDTVTVPVGGGSGTIALSTAGARTLTVEYLGDGNFTGSTSAGEPHTVEEGDFGDAPDSYGTLLASDGARHAIGSGLFLGVAVDGEPDGQPSANADGDDATGVDDEDGVTFTSALAAGETVALDVVASGAGVLNAWVDFDNNGDWADAGEQVFTDQALVAGTNPLTFTVPAAAIVASTYARFRFSTASGLDVTGAAPDGEVEDYAVEILGTDFGDAPDPAYATLRASNGARHMVVAGPSLGAAPDAEPDGVQSADATGDDTTGSDDEDGVVFTSTLTLEAAATVDVAATNAGKLNAWIDFNQNGSWTDAGEQIFADVTLVNGPNSLNYSVPVTAHRGMTFARFRYDTDGGLAPTGLAEDGEVEDYAVDIVGLPSTVVVTSTGSPSFNTQEVTFFATVSGTAGTATGTVQFLDGVAPLGSVPLNASGIAEFSTSTLSVGLHTIFANYLGGATYEPSSGSVPHTVDACTPASVTQDPVDQTVCEGTKAVFRAKGSGGPAPTVQWQVDNGAGFEDLPGETGNRLRLQNVTADMDGYRYRAIFTGGCGPDAVSAEAMLTVQTAPEVPEPQLVFGHYPESDFVSATDGLFSTKIHVTWSPVAGASEYRVYRSTKADLSDAVAVTDWMADRFYNDYDVNVTEVGGLRCNRQIVPILYYYQVQARGLCGESEPSEADTGYASTKKALYEDTLPSASNGGPYPVAGLTDSLAVRLNAGEAIDLSSVWGMIYAAGPLDVSGIAIVPVSDTDLWVEYVPSVPWEDGEAITMTVGAMTSGGHMVGPITATFVIDAAVAVPLSDLVPQPSQADIAAKGYDDPAIGSSNDTWLSLTDGSAPSLAGGAGEVYFVGPAAPFTAPQRVWLPIPTGLAADDLEIYYLDQSGPSAQWVPGGDIEGWLASPEFDVLDLEGQQYLGVLVNHGGTVGLGARGVSEQPVAKAAVGDFSDSAGLVTLTILAVLAAACVSMSRARQRIIHE